LALKHAAIIESTKSPDPKRLQEIGEDVTTAIRIPPSAAIYQSRKLQKLLQKLNSCHWPGR